MGTYENCYDIIADVRQDINEYSEAYVQGSDIGSFTNELITQKINLAQHFIYNLLFKRKPHFYMEEVSLTAVNSVFTLPSNYADLIWFKDANGLPVKEISVKDLTPNGGVSENHYYRKGNTLVLEKEGSTKTYTLFYKWKPRKIFAGKATAGGALSITFPTTASKLADFYNGMVIENKTQDWVDTISDYSTSRVATIAGTAAQDDYFGLVSELPEPFHHLLSPRASMLVRASSPLAQKKVDKAEMDLFNEDFIETFRAYAGSSEDQEISDIFQDYEIGNASFGITV
jgi:hypothetical protein